MPRHIIDSVKGAKASALLYSIAESAKANSLKSYEYFKHLLTELVKHSRGNVPEKVLASLMPWSGSLPDCQEVRVQLKQYEMCVALVMTLIFSGKRGMEVV
ncbi:MAG: transposase domain-containing protein [Eubacterium sp.]|nr:transposase domain-containing protein [Eubacterium sp.]